MFICNGRMLLVTRHHNSGVRTRRRVQGDHNQTTRKVQGEQRGSADLA